MKNTLNQKFDDFEDEPDRDVWAAIELELRPKQRGIFVYQKYIWAAAASVALFLGIGYFSLYSPKKNQAEMVQNAVETPSQVPVISPKMAETPLENPAQTVAQAAVSPTKATQSIKRIKMADGRTLIEKTETYIVTEKKTYEVQAETKKEVQVAQSVEKQPVQSATLVTPEEIKPVPQAVVAAAESKSEPWQVYNVPTQATNTQPVKSVKVASKSHGKNTQLDLNNTNPVQLASFASTQLNKVANTPVKVNYQENKKTNQVKYEIGFKDFKIVRKVGKKG